MTDNSALANNTLQLVKKLEYRCSEETSAKLRSIIDSTDSTISSNIEKANAEIIQIIKNISINISDVSNANKLQISNMSSHIKDLCEYILKSYRSNLLQISTTQNDILSDYYNNLKKISDELLSLMDYSNNCQEIKPLVDVENRVQKILPTFTQPKNYEIYKDLKQQEHCLATLNNDIKGETSPKPSTYTMTSPSTPVPVPDQPLPKVLVPKSINSTSKRTYISPTLLKEKGTENKGENNLKRKFSSVLNQDNEGKELEEDTNKKTAL